MVVILDGEAEDRSRDVVSDCACETGFESGIVVAPVVFSRAEWETGASRYSVLDKAAVQVRLAV